MTILHIFRASTARRARSVASRLAAILSLLSAMSASARASEPVDDLLAGLHATAEGQFEHAIPPLNKATTAESGHAAWQLDRAIALMLSGHDQEAQAALTLAAKLDPQNEDVSVWQLAHAGLTGRKLPPLEMSGGVRLPTPGPMEMLFDPSLPPIHLPTSSVSYANKLLLSIMGLRSANTDERTKARNAIEDVARQFARDQASGIDTAKALYALGRYRQALGLLEPMLLSNKGNGTVLAYTAHCKLALADYSEARSVYTEALRVFQTQAGCFIGRARCEIALHSLEAAELDLTVAKRINDPNAAALLVEADKLLATQKTRGPASSEPLIRREQDQRELCRIELDARDHPDDVADRLALVRFYLRPTAPGDLTIDGHPIRAIVPCGSMDVASAAAVLSQAVKLAPDRPDVLLEQARVAYAQDHRDQMMVFARQAMSKGAIDLEMGVAWMRFDSNLAKEKSAQAATLANPPAGTWYWKPAGTTYVRVYTGRSPDFPGADALNRQAKELRAEATRGLELLQKQTASSTLPRDRVIADMVDAYHDFWFGDLDGAIESGEKAQAIDPFNEHVLRFLVATCGKAKSPKVKQYKAILDELEWY